jgi:hypothetical protein
MVRTREAADSGKRPTPFSKLATKATLNIISATAMVADWDQFNDHTFQKRNAPRPGCACCHERSHKCCQRPRPLALCRGSVWAEVDANTIRRTFGKDAVCTEGKIDSHL